MIKLGLIGYPVNHSLSPKIQSAALKAAELQGEYSLYPIHPDDMQGLSLLIDRVRSGEMTGLNVTIPHKQNVIRFLDELTSAAQAIGAVNIVYEREGRAIGDNTDALGFLKDLNNNFSSFDRRSSLILGAGGSARSVAFALLNNGWEVSLFARREEQAYQFRDSFSNFKIRIVSSLETEISKNNLLINTTPVGMTPNVDRSPLPDGLSLPENLIIYDLIYNPRETKLVRKARSQGIKAVTGLGMLIEQAALGFKLWTGRDVSAEVFRNAINS